jgi:hypothetical protein
MSSELVARFTPLSLLLWVTKRVKNSTVFTRRGLENVRYCRQMRQQIFSNFAVPFQMIQTPAAMMAAKEDQV